MVAKPTKRDSARNISFNFAGEKVLAKDGDSFASALTSAGIYDLKESLDGSRRGLYCGMGVCNECAIVVNGDSGKLACMTSVCDGDEVSRQPAAAHVATSSAVALPE